MLRQEIGWVEADQKNDIVSYLMTVAEYQILKQEGKSDFESVNAVRERAKNYLNKFSGKGWKTYSQYKRCYYRS